MTLPHQALRLYLALKSISLLLAFLLFMTSSTAQAGLPAVALGQQPSLDMAAVLFAILGVVSLTWLRCHGWDLVSPRRIGGRI